MHDKDLRKEQQGLVVSSFGHTIAVEAENGEIYQCSLRRNQEAPVVGDRVTWQLSQENTGQIIAIVPRSTQLARGENRGQRKVIASNIDIMVIMMAPAPILSEYLIDRYIVASELLEITPLIVINKIDLLNETEKSAQAKQLSHYETLGYPVLPISVLAREGLEQLMNKTQTKTSVLVGPSGVGKSSLIAAFGPLEMIRIGDVSPKGLGKHTTTATRLYHLPHRADLIDSPGVREFNLWHITPSEVMSGFRELTSLKEPCRFRDCKHMREPGCMVQKAVQDGKMSAERFKSYETLMQQAESHKKYK